MIAVPETPDRGKRSPPPAAQASVAVRLRWKRTGILVLLTGWAIAAQSGSPERVLPVSALGRLEPLGGVVHVASPNAIQGPSILGQLLVEEGQSVTNQQTLATTHTHASARAAWTHAVRLVEAARARLAQAEAGVEPAEIAVLEAEVQRNRAELEDASRDLERVRQLRSSGTSSQQALDTADTLVLTRTFAAEAAQRRLAAGREVRIEDVAVARAELAVAEAQAERSREEWQQTIIRAPQSGRILSIHTRIGEVVGTDGVLDLGPTDTMTVKAEVYETDLRHVRPEQRAEITADAFDGILRGRVGKIGLQVGANRLLKPDPSEFADSRVVEVVVLLDDSTRVSNLTGALVNVRFLP
jgi:HlyD family secretion protein